MSRDLAPHDIELWEAGEAAARQMAASNGAEDRETVSAMRAIALVFVLCLPVLISGVVALVRHLLSS